MEEKDDSSSETVIAKESAQQASVTEGTQTRDDCSAPGDQCQDCPPLLRRAAREHHLAQNPFTISDALRGLLGPSLDESVLETCQLIEDWGGDDSARQRRRLRRGQRKVRLAKKEKACLEDELRRVEDEKKLAAEEATAICQLKASVAELRERHAQRERELELLVTQIEREREKLNQEKLYAEQKKLSAAEEDSVSKNIVPMEKTPVSTTKPLSQNNKSKRETGPLNICESEFFRDFNDQAKKIFTECTEHEVKTTSERCYKMNITSSVHHEKTLTLEQHCVNEDVPEKAPKAKPGPSNETSEQKCPEIKRKRKKTRSMLRMAQGFKSLQCNLAELTPSSCEELDERARNKPRSSPSETCSCGSVPTTRTSAASPSGPEACGQPVVTKTLWALTKINKFSDGCEVMEIRGPFKMTPENIPTQVDKMMVVNGKHFD
ncbi:uncharacterized protein LOC134538534 isoform X2 [Bacillus rossius redtenbacheri]|uniref:uncharacterized protein LOC134538534 isoform X2 n=1 Tax=Bacillus rossius redtenbacheri TaxID=93214 RepID=UPI002FDE13F6